MIAFIDDDGEAGPDTKLLPRDLVQGTPASTGRSGGAEPDRISEQDVRLPIKPPASDEPGPATPSKAAPATADLGKPAPAKDASSTGAIPPAVASGSPTRR